MLSFPSGLQVNDCKNMAVKLVMEYESTWAQNKHDASSDIMLMEKKYII